MAVLAWNDILPSEINQDSPLTEGLIAKFHQNQEVLISVAVDTKFDETGQFGTATAIFPVFIPPGVVTADGDVRFVVNFDYSVNDPTWNGSFGVTLGTQTEIGVPGMGDTAGFWTTLFAIVPKSDLIVYAGLEVDLRIRTVSEGAGAARAHLRDTGASSRIERLA